MLKENQKRKPINLPVIFRQAEPASKLPKIALYQMGQDGKIAKKISELANEGLSIPWELEKQKLPIALGPDTKDLIKLEVNQLIQFYPQQIIPDWKTKGFIEIPDNFWRKWLSFVQCVSGKLSRCYFVLNPRLDFDSPRRSSNFPLIPNPVIFDPFPPLFRYKCVPICYGKVEIYRRVCCCSPWVLIPRLPELIPDILRRIPNPIPPNPGPLRRQISKPLRKVDSLLTSVEPARGTVVEQRVIDDLKVLYRLKNEQEQFDFLNVRPYLLPVLCWRYECTTTKIGETNLGPDGTFIFCFFHSVPPPNCRVTYFYKVRQFNGNQDVYIYDGEASHAYYSAREFADLTTVHPQAATCEVIKPPVTGLGKPFVLFQAIGATGTHQLNSPIQNSENGLSLTTAPLNNNYGLINYPDTRGCPLAKKLDLLLYIDPAMKDISIGATYYRFSLAHADDEGNPIGEYEILQKGVSWRRFQPGTFPPKIEGIGLGPRIIEETIGLYKIPFLTLEDRWLANQFHYQLDTEEYENGRYLLKVEIFDENGRKIRPEESDGEGIEKSFHFLKWVAPNTTGNVNFDSLIHVVHFDNLPCRGEIVHFRSGTESPSRDNCQFLSGTAEDKFRVDFRAYHENDFMKDYNLKYFKGLDGTAQNLDSGGSANQPDTKDTGNPATSAAITFGEMLDGNDKCSFSIRLKVHAKHTNGRNRIRLYDYEEIAAVALEKT